VKVRAIAIATARANLVGSVELTSSPSGLQLVYVDAAQLGADGAPVAFDPGTVRIVPWERVVDARVVGNAVLLELEVGPSMVQRMLLVRFSFGTDQSLHTIRQRRLLLRLFAVAAGLMTVATSTVVLPRLSPGAGPFVGLGLGVFLAAIISVVGIATDHWLTTGGQPSALVREIFAGELMSMLPRLPREPAAAFSFGLKLPNLEGLLPRTTLAITITFAGALLAALVMAKWALWGDHSSPHEAASMARERRRAAFDDTASATRPTEPAEPARPPAPRSDPPTATSGSAMAATAATPSAGVASRGACTCPRADSPLWREPLPRLTPLVLASRRVPHKNHEDIELELAVVNNSDRPLGNISVLVEFFEADQSNVTRLTSVESRTVFFEGPLAAGKAIKWHVEERGTIFKIHPPTSNGLIVDEAIGPLGEGAASAAAFIELLHANNRPVRLHAAMMLAYLGDKRARAGVVELGEALRDSESGYLRRLLEATNDVIPCQLELGPAGNPRSLRACVFNAGSQPLTNGTLTLNLLDATISPKDPVAPPPQIIAERPLRIGASIAPKTGMLVETSVDWSELPLKPASYEVLVSGSVAP
jgi:hypothetical protein